MRLTLNSWPALASHFTCILLGLFFSQIGRENNPEQAQPIQKNESLIAIDVLWIYPEGLNISEPMHLIQLVDGASPCAAHPFPFRVVRRSGHSYLVVKQKDLPALKALFETRSLQRLTTHSAAKALGACPRVTTVSYGL